MPLEGYPQRSSCEPFTASTFQALRAPTPCTPPDGGAGGGGGGVQSRPSGGSLSTCPFIGLLCSLVWERWTTCWVTMRAPVPNVPPPPCRSPRLVLPPGGGGGGPSLAQPKIFRCSSLCCCGKTTTQECCPKHSSGKW